MSSLAGGPRDQKLAAFLQLLFATVVAERVGWIENQSASLEEALEELSLVLEERDALQRVTSFRKRATSFRKAGPESQAL